MILNLCAQSVAVPANSEVHGVTPSVPDSQDEKRSANLNPVCDEDSFESDLRKAASLAYYRNKDSEREELASEQAQIELQMSALNKLATDLRNIQGLPGMERYRPGKEREHTEAQNRLNILKRNHNETAEARSNERKRLRALM